MGGLGRKPITLLSQPKKPEKPHKPPPNVIPPDVDIFDYLKKKQPKKT
jgi:hypothetical protein